MLILQNFIIFYIIVTVYSQTPAKPLTTGYNQDLAKKLLRLSAGAYSTDPTPCIKEAFNDNGNYEIFNNQTTICDKGGNVCTYYTIVSNQTKEIIIVFRGTKTNDQLLREAVASLLDGVDFKGIGLVNRYFLKAHNVLWDYISEVFKVDEYKTYKLSVTGHSLGGALAALCAIRVQMEGYRESNNITLYTFGEPRVGSASFAFKFDDLVPHSWRVVHALDIVPHLPGCAKPSGSSLLQVYFGKTSQPCDPTALDEPYHHGTEIWYPEGMGENDIFYECTGTPKNEDFDCSDQYKLPPKNLNTYINEHRHYFDHKVPAFGKLGCSPGLEEEEETLSDDAE
uniref:Lipase_3 domain-containing protein n=1 Tax=Parastrongyloides trichosuri TaxID=131310 RepID=A0A0N4Z635_PARTI